MSTTTATTFDVKSIGTIRSNDTRCAIEVDEAYRPALKELGGFSHVIVLWWAHQQYDQALLELLQTKPPYADHITAGIFATRAPYRPNPIAMSVCPIISVDEATGKVVIGKIDAMDGTPLIDLKAYFPVLDRVQDAHMPEWLEGWPEWMPGEGVGMEY